MLRAHGRVRVPRNRERWRVAVLQRVRHTARRGGPALLEERKTVTALFCDLVGFTAASESADPEDVARMLGAHAAMARRQVEVHGGVVEKFVGDAVMGVALGRLDLLERLRAAPTGAIWADGLARTSWSAIAAEAGGRHADALDGFRVATSGWHAFGDPDEEAHSLLGQGRCLVVLGRPDEAATPVHRARRIFERLGAAPALAEADALLDTVRQSAR